MRNKNFNDWAVALIVIACSVMLFLALAFALSGKTLGQPARPLRVNFHDTTGINLGSQVKFAGAIAGKVSSIRMLAAEERATFGDPLNAVQVLLTINPGVPPLPSDVSASIAADTLLSDKFVLLSGGSSNAAPLPADAVLQGISPTTFDKLTRTLDTTLEALRGMVGGTKGEAGSIVDRIRSLLTETQSLIGDARPLLQDAQSLLNDAKPVVQEAKVLTTDARQLIAENRAPLTRAITQLEKSAGAFEAVATSANRLLVQNEKKLASAISDFNVTSQNLKITSTYTRILIRSLTQRPSQLIWGTRRPPVLPSKEEILRNPSPLPSN
jgi:phospholipid/cholesterol/gamma-HCH transport system substrate-binding protein